MRLKGRGMEEAAVVAHHFWNEPGGAELVMVRESS